MASFGEAVLCSFCLQYGQSVSDTRKLLCGHLACSTCIESVLKMTPELECPTCKFKSEVADVNILECLKQSSETFDGTLLAKCGACQHKPASVFCVKCQILLCSLHSMEDNTQAESAGRPVHHHVKYVAYMKNKQLYKRHYCKKHADDEVTLACMNCYALLCCSCIASQSRCYSNDLHEFKAVSEVAEFILFEIQDFQALLSDHSNRYQSLMKDTYRKMESYKNTTNERIAEVNRTMQEQIEQITQEGEKLKLEILELGEKFSKFAEKHIEKVISCDEIVMEQMSDLQSVTRTASDVHIVERYPTIVGRCKAALNTYLRPVHIPSKRLVSTGIYRSLEAKFSFTFPNAIEYKRSAGDGSNECYSVRWVSHDCLVTASETGIDILDGDLTKVKSIEISGIEDITPYGRELIVLKRISSEAKSIDLYSMQLEKIREIATFSTEEQFLSQISAIDEKVVACNCPEKCLLVWNMEGRPVGTIDLSDTEDPSGLCTTSDGCVLVTDRAVKGSLRKYQLGGDYSLIWRADNLVYPLGVSENENGDIFVNGGYLEESVIYHLSFKGKLKKTIKIDELHGREQIYGLSILNDVLAVASSKGVKLLQLIFSQ